MSEGDLELFELKTDKVANLPPIRPETWQKYEQDSLSWGNRVSSFGSQRESLETEIYV
jgi:hypothetical protein